MFYEAPAILKMIFFGTIIFAFLKSCERLHGLCIEIAMYQFQCCYKNVKISYKVVSSSKFDTDDARISFQSFDLILRKFMFFS